jgi:hypothetical protein
MTEDCVAEPEIVPEEGQIIPPLTRLRLVIAMALVAGALLAFWAAVNHQQFYGLIVATMCFSEISRVIDPHGLRRGTLHGVLSEVVVLGVCGALFWWRELPAVSAVLGHPVSYAAAWLMACSLLLMDWWKRRNNPPYQPDPHAKRSVFSSLWRTIPRMRNRR